MCVPELEPIRVARLRKRRKPFSSEHVRARSARSCGRRRRTRVPLPAPVRARGSVAVSASRPFYARAGIRSPRRRNTEPGRRKTSVLSVHVRPKRHLLPQITRKSNEDFDMPSRQAFWLLASWVFGVVMGGLLDRPDNSLHFRVICGRGRFQRSVMGVKTPAFVRFLQCVHVPPRARTIFVVPCVPIFKKEPP